MTPEKKQFLPFKAAAATAVAMGVLASANGAETDVPAPVAITATVPDAALAGALLAKTVVPEPSITIHFQITSPYGDRDDPEHRGSREDHKGIDFAPVGGGSDIPVFQPLGHGRVTGVGRNIFSGKYVDVSYGADNKGEDIELRFFHLDSTSVRMGQEIDRGTKIGTVGNTGLFTTGKHLHVGLYRNDKADDLAFLDHTTVKSMDMQPSAEMFDVTKTGRGRHATYAPGPDKGTPILVAIDPQMPGVIRGARGLEKDGCIEQDGHRGLTCSGLNAEALGISPETLRAYREKDFQREYEHRYVAYGVRFVPSDLKFNYFANAINFGVVRAKEILAEAGGDEAKQLKLTALRYDSVMIKNPDLFYADRNGWNNDRMQKLWAASGTKHPFHEFELITSLPSHDRALAEVAVLAKKMPEKTNATLTPVVQGRHLVLAQATPYSSQWSYLLNSQIDLHPAIAGRDSLTGKNTAPFTIASTTTNPSMPEFLQPSWLVQNGGKAVSPTAMMKASESTVSASNETAGKIAGTLLALAGLLATALKLGRGLVSKVKAIPVAIRATPKKVKAVAAARPFPEVASLAARRATKSAAMPASNPAPVQAAPAAAVIKPTAVEAVQAARREAIVAHIEPRMTVPTDIFPTARPEPTIALSDKKTAEPEAMPGRTSVVITPRETAASQSASAAPTSEARPAASAAPLAPAFSLASLAARTLREGGKHSALPDGKGWQVNYPDKSFTTVEKGLITAHNVRPSSDRALNRTLQLAEKIQKDDINVRINYSNGASMTVEKDRIAVHNAPSAEDIVVERALRAAAERFKGNFKIKVKGKTAKERHDMARSVKETALRLGLAGRVVLTGNDDDARVTTMRATTDLELTAHRPAAKTADPDFRELKRA